MNMNRTHTGSLFSHYLLISIFILLSMNSHSRESNSEANTNAWKQFNIDAVKGYVIPAYEALNTQSQALHESIVDLCKAPVNSEYKQQRSQRYFHSTMDAWQYIQNIQFGPIQTMMRNYSLQFWPDKKNHVSKHLLQLLNTKNPEALTKDAFHKASVSIKGLPAIERFLFDDELNNSLSTRPFNCKVLMRISSYTADTSAALVEEWQAFEPQFSVAGSFDSYFEDDIEATTTLLKTLIEPIEVIRDLKLLRPLGSQFKQQKMKRLESWRSQRSLRNIQYNIKSLADFFHETHLASAHLTHLLDKSDINAIRQQFSEITQQLLDIPEPIEHSINTEAGYNALKILSTQLKTLHTLLEDAINKQGIHLGFNSRDGD